MPNMTMQVGGLEVTLIQLKHSKVALRDAAGPAMIAAGEAYRDMVRKRISLTDHSLDDLAAMDHPYARRHGKIRIHRQKPWQVHKQSGRMRNALRGHPIFVAGNQGYEVTFDYAAAPHAAYVISGTKVMLPRDVLWRTAKDPVTEKSMMRRVVRVLGEQMRTKLGVRFRSTSTARGSFGAGGGATSVR